MFGVEMNSFLPNQQSNGRDLARQREARHGWFHPSGHASLVEILKRSGGGSRSRGGTLEDILQIVIMVLVQSTNGQDFLGALTWGLSRSCSHVAQVPSSKVTCKLPRSP